MDSGRSAVDQSSKKLFCLQLKLTASKLEYQPSLASDSGNDGFMQIIVRLMNDICSMAHQIDRIVQPTASASNATKRSYKSK